MNEYKKILFWSFLFACQYACAAQDWGEQKLNELVRVLQNTNRKEQDIASYNLSTFPKGSVPWLLDSIDHNPATVRLLLRHGLELKISSVIMTRVVARNKLEALKLYVELQGPIDSFMVIDAASNNEIDAEILHYLLTTGYEKGLFKKDDPLQLPLGMALTSKNLAKVKILVKAGAKTNHILGSASALDIVTAQEAKESPQAAELRQYLIEQRCPDNRQKLYEQLDNSLNKMCNAMDDAEKALENRDAAKNNLDVVLREQEQVQFRLFVATSFVGLGITALCCWWWLPRKPQKEKIDKAVIV